MARTSPARGALVVDDYLPIEDHGVVGNLRTAALVGRDGSIDWCCLPYLDSPSVFASLLDHERGGRFRIRPVGVDRGDQRYIEDTNVLETIFDGSNGSDGRLVVTDFLPLVGSIEGTNDQPVDPTLYRLLRAEDGDVEVDVEWSPRFDYARGRITIMPTDGEVLAWAGSDAAVLCGLDDVEIEQGVNGPLVRGRCTLRAGEERAVVTRWGAERLDVTLDDAQRRLAETVAAWREWVRKGDATSARDWAGEQRDLVVRSELVLKLLTFAETGAIAAAVTTSLPEDVGGVRNWDYRYPWIRDASLAAQALFALGHREDATAFVLWAERTARDEGRRNGGLQIMYGLRGQLELEEREHPQLEGYRRSSPVRTGNEAVEQVQLDIFGELISAAYELVRHGEELSPDVCEFLPWVVDEACRTWTEPDDGIWEVRNGPFHFVYSKAMVWAALDRAVRLADQGLIDGTNAERWQRNRDEVRDELLERGFSTETGAFRQTYERDVLDASNLLLPLLEVLPFSDPRVQSNLDRTIEELSVDGLVYRYRSDDGIAGGEATFGLCTFWLVDALAMAGRVEEARSNFEAMAGHANHLGLFAEQIDAATGAHLGNFPQALTHIGLINSALYLAYAEGRSSPVSDPIGSEEHRATSV